ncbi:uncharacterized protein LOC119085114 [Bradysia coprophila]|uniref:uncharacterized protein LOC119085114 n=1 Tax=Bradysia coprophila TaxID=38358 RepID=UPI00187DCAD7|nr:uncharacterized protein LOC119085114 [Bradysia coprophila]
MEESNLLRVNLDCKMKIFEYLGYRDLISIAETCKQLHAVASDVFKRKFGKGKLALCPEHLDESSRPWIKSFEDEAPNMRPDTRLVILKLLRHFGHLVSHIFLNYEKHIAILPYSFRHHLEDYVAKYCSKTLSNLTLIVRPKVLFDDNAVPFTNVKSLEMCESSSLSIAKVPFTECFPNLHSLTWNAGSYNGLKARSIKVGFPSVKHMIVSKGRCNEDCNSCASIIKLWELNPQLIELELHHDPDKCRIKLFPCIRDFLPNLQIFKVAVYEWPISGETIHFDSVVEFKLHLFRYCVIIPFTFARLKSFCVTYYTKEAQSNVSDFIAKNEHLKTLHVYYTKDSSRLTEMVSVLSIRIEELTITDYVMLRSEVVLRLLTEIRSLKKLVLVARRYNPSSFNSQVRAKIVNEEKCGELFYVTLHPWNR